MAELHVFGEISDAEDFKQAALFCKWSFHAGNALDFLIENSINFLKAHFGVQLSNCVEPIC